MENPDIDCNGASWATVRTQNVGAAGQVGVDVARGEATTEFVSKFLGEPEVKREFIWAEVPNGCSIHIRERDVAQ